MQQRQLVLIREPGDVARVWFRILLGRTGPELASLH
jgi:hypothetical protein